MLPQLLLVGVAAAGVSATAIRQQRGEYEPKQRRQIFTTVTVDWLPHVSDSTSSGSASSSPSTGGDSPIPRSVTSSGYGVIPTPPYGWYTSGSASAYQAPSAPATSTVSTPCQELTLTTTITTTITQPNASATTGYYPPPEPTGYGWIDTSSTIDSASATESSSNSMSPGTAKGHGPSQVVTAGAAVVTRAAGLMGALAVVAIFL